MQGERESKMHIDAPFREVIDIQSETFNTGLQEAGESFWLDDRQFLVTAVQEDQEGLPVEQQARTRVVLVNWQARTMRTIAEKSRLLHATASGAERRIVIGLRYTATWHTADRQHYGRAAFADLREIAIDADGQLHDLCTYGPNSSPPRLLAGLPGIPLDGGTAGSLARETFKTDRADRRPRYRDESDLATFAMACEAEPAYLPATPGTLWLRDSEPTMRLPLRFEEISCGQYLPFMDRFLLNDGDSSETPQTNSHLSNSWTHPYEFTPYRLLARDGTIEEIPYPEFIFDFGLAPRKWHVRNGVNFSKFQVVRGGLVVTKTGENAPGVYLFRDNQLYRVSRDGSHGMRTLRLSPDGRKLAYTHLAEPATGKEHKDKWLVTIVRLTDDDSAQPKHKKRGKPAKAGATSETATAKPLQSTSDLLMSHSRQTQPARKKATTAAAARAGLEASSEMKVDDVWKTGIAKLRLPTQPE